MGGATEMVASTRPDGPRPRDLWKILTPEQRERIGPFSHFSLEAYETLPVECQTELFDFILKKENGPKVILDRAAQAHDLFIILDQLGYPHAAETVETFQEFFRRISDLFRREIVRRFLLGIRNDDDADLCVQFVNKTIVDGKWPNWQQDIEEENSRDFNRGRRCWR